MAASGTRVRAADGPELSRLPPHADGTDIHRRVATETQPRSGAVFGDRQLPACGEGSRVNSRLICETFHGLVEAHPAAWADLHPVAEEVKSHGYPYMRADVPPTFRASDEQNGEEGAEHPNSSQQADDSCRGSEQRTDNDRRQCPSHASLDLSANRHILVSYCVGAINATAPGPGVSPRSLPIFPSRPHPASRERRLAASEVTLERTLYFYDRLSRRSDERKSPSAVAQKIPHEPSMRDSSAALLQSFHQ
jgi:hypothetical protein